jgi:phosphinothricin acetyltransferase
MGCSVRIATASDAAAIAAIYRPIVESTVVSFEVDPPGEPDMRKRIQDTVRVYPWLVCEIGGEVAGYAYASRHNERAAYQWSVNTSVYVHASFRRDGVGRYLYTSLLGILAAQGFFNAYAGITLPNPASVGLHERMGFEPLGVYRRVGYKQGAWHDVGWWQLALQASEEPPRTPIALEDFRNHREPNALLFSRRDHPARPGGLT